MDILIQSLLDKVRKFNTSLHIRYYAQPQALGASNVSVGTQEQPHSSEGAKGMTSYVIIRREYSYLEPLVRSLFADASDVTVLIDRRSADRRAPGTTPAESGRPVAAERRASNPMLDILIDVES